MLLWFVVIGILLLAIGLLIVMNMLPVAEGRPIAYIMILIGLGLTIGGVWTG